MAQRSTAFQAIGTHWNIKVQQLLNDGDWYKLLERLNQRIDDFDSTYSRFRADSLVTKMSQHSGSYKLPADGYKLLNFYHALYKITDGAVTPLIGQTMVQAGYDAAYSLRRKTLHRPPRWEETIRYNQATVIMKQPALLDFGAAGKGYLVDIIGELFEAAGVRNYTINAGGDIRHRSRGDGAIAVGLENPLDTTEAIGLVSLGNKSICASAGSKRKWANLTHIINPTTLDSPSDILATWVIASDTMTADGLATALFFTKPEKMLDQFSFSYAILSSDLSLQTSSNFPVAIFEAN